MGTTTTTTTTTVTVTVHLKINKSRTSKKENRRTLTKFAEKKDIHNKSKLDKQEMTQIATHL